ncbi:MAG: hypothetical protein NUV77_20465 [Thermoguttaceae bacterium]|jgi:hypothetical protein|nr:hypothetical protein [Thermoguttaceae bacterium]
MTKHHRHGRATNRIVRTPATRFGHLRKRMEKTKGVPRAIPKTKK